MRIFRIQTAEFRRKMMRTCPDIRTMESLSYIICASEQMPFSRIVFQIVSEAHRCFKQKQIAPVSHKGLRCTNARAYSRLMAMAQTITPKVLKGFRDILPEAELRRRAIIQRIEESCRSFGFVPIDTPVLEYTEVLLGKGSGETDKQMYRFHDNGGRDVAMRFDLTVPFARFMAAHENELYLPFKRYHFDKVWRGENTQRGRYREFMQCDFDIVGVDSPAADFEIIQLMQENFSSLGIDKLTFRISHRGLFNHFLTALDIREHSVAVLRIVDKLPKVGTLATTESLATLVGLEKASDILSYIQVRESNAQTLQNMEQLSGGPSEESQRLASLLELAQSMGMEKSLVIDPSITRGLDYYTGIVYETFLDELPDIGSVCSGGRYNDLANLYTKNQLPGVGSSIGLDRLMAALEEIEQKRKDEGSATGLNIQPRDLRSVDVLVLMLDEAYLAQYSAIARAFRNAGFRAEVFPSPKKLAQQFSYAEKKRIPLGIIAGESELSAGTLNYKHLIHRSGREGIGLEEALRQAAEDLREG